MNKVASPEVTAKDRLGTTVTIAVAIHAIVILGISFTATFRDNVTQERPLEIIIANTRSVEAPEDAENIAQFNQQASGQADTPGKPGSEMPSTRPTDDPGIAPIEQAQQLMEQKQEQAQKVLTSTDSPVAIKSEEDTQEDNTTKSKKEKQIREHELKMAQLAAEIKEAEQRFAERPRVRFIDSLSAKGAAEALYVKDWVRRVESMGNLNYPATAREQNLQGRLTLSVRLDAKGHIVLVEVTHSSGSKALDDSAIQIVRLAAPYLPFNIAMKEKYDQIDITRTWIFRGGNNELH